MSGRELSHVSKHGRDFLQVFFHMSRGLSLSLSLSLSLLYQQETFLAFIFSPGTQSPPPLTVRTPPPPAPFVITFCMFSAAHTCVPGGGGGFTLGGFFHPVFCHSVFELWFERIERIFAFSLLPDQVTSPLAIPYHLNTSFQPLEYFFRVLPFCQTNVPPSRHLHRCLSVKVASPNLQRRLKTRKAIFFVVVGRKKSRKFCANFAATCFCC